MSLFLSPRQFAEAIGVSESSVRRWADSGQIQMTRTAGGHRKIAQTEAIRFIRETSAQVIRPDLLELNEPRHRRRRAEAFAAQHEQLFSALEQGDAEVVVGLLTRMYVGGVSAASICDGALRHAMQRIGDKWPSDKRGIFVEHRATSICIDALNQLRSRFPASKDQNGIALGGAPEKDPYVLPSLMAATVLADVGFRVVNLGPNTPLDVLAQSSLELNAKLAWISFTAPLPKAQVENDLSKAARRLARKKVFTVVGGRSASRFRLPTVANLRAFSSMTEMADFAEGLLGK
jgi:excisionase family DNA binding protein